MSSGIEWRTVLERIELADLTHMRDSFSKKMADIRRSQQTCSHLIISVITCGIFAIIKATYLWFLEIGVTDINKKISKLTLANGVLGKNLFHSAAGRMQIEVKDLFDKMKEMTKGLIQALQHMAESSSKQDDIAVLFDKITAIFADLKKGLGSKQAMCKDDAEKKLKEAVDFLDKAYEKARKNFGGHKEFNAFEEFCLKLRNNLTSDITYALSTEKSIE
jgi:hypothetical protein